MMGHVDVDYNLVGRRPDPSLRWKLAAAVCGTLAVALAAAAAHTSSQLATANEALVQLNADMRQRELDLSRSRSMVVDLQAAQSAAVVTESLHSKEKPAACSSHPLCSGLEGDCCPTSSGSYLGCCASPAPKKEKAKAKVDVDPHTPQTARDKYKEKELSLIFSDEFKSLERTKKFFVFEDMPYGVPGNTGDVNIVSTYSSDMVEMIPGGGLRMKCEMEQNSYAKFMVSSSSSVTASSFATATSTTTSVTTSSVTTTHLHHQLLHPFTRRASSQTAPTSTTTACPSSGTGRRPRSRRASTPASSLASSRCLSRRPRATARGPAR